MSGHVALVANDSVRAPAERSRRSDLVDRAGVPEVAKQATETASTTPTPTSVKKDVPELEIAVETVRAVVTDLQRELQFSVDENSGRTVITVIDRESGEIIRQIPSEELLQIAEKIASGGNINLIDSRA